MENQLLPDTRGLILHFPLHVSRIKEKIKIH